MDPDSELERLREDLHGVARESLDTADAKAKEALADVNARWEVEIGKRTCARDRLMGLEDGQPGRAERGYGSSSGRSWRARSRSSCP